MRASPQDDTTDVARQTDANDLLSQIANDNLAKQISCSWVWSGGPNATTDQLFQQFAAQGQSFFQASGDWGAYWAVI